MMLQNKGKILIMYDKQVLTLKIYMNVDIFEENFGFFRYNVWLKFFLDFLYIISYRFRRAEFKFVRIICLALQDSKKNATFGKLEIPKIMKLGVPV